MQKRFLTIWFRYLKTDWLTRRRPALVHTPFVLAAPDHGRMIITAVNIPAQKQGINRDMVLADARAIYPSLQYMEDKQEPSGKLLQTIAAWCIRYSPWVVADPPDGLILDITGCTHLWGGETTYLTSIINRFKLMGYTVRTGIADTIGASWAIARFGKDNFIVETGQQEQALLDLPASALRLSPEIIERLHKLGLRETGSFIHMPRSALRRRFGEELLQRIDQALGNKEEITVPVLQPEPWQERLPCLEPITTRTGIEIALQRLLESLCKRLQQQQKGLRVACFKCYRIDGKMQQIKTGTNRASYNVSHLFKLFELKLDTIEPELGIEMFVLEASKVEDAPATQENLWEGTCGLADTKFSELIDRIEGKIGAGHIHRYLPDEHYWPERSVKPAVTLHEKITMAWNTDRPRPVQLLSIPEPIQVTAPIPDYPPMNFRYKQKLHTVKKADGPERIEAEWWLQEGQHRDYYVVEDEEGQRYWLFRSGHYEEGHEWFIHGFFA